MEQVIRVFQEAWTFLASVLRPTLRSVRENTGLAGLSVVLAFGVWIFITDAETSTTTRVLPVDIAVQPVNVPSDVALADEISPVRVRIRVADDVFDSLTAADFEATVNLENLPVGEYVLPVDVRPLTTRGALRIEGVLPAEVTVRLAQLESRSVDVLIEVEGDPPPGFTMGPAEPAHATALVIGTQERVGSVIRAVGEIDVTGRTQSVDQSVRLTARDDRGFLVQGVSIEPSVTDVRIAIEQRRFSRDLAISAQIEGTPADGYNVAGVSVNPATVTVLGSEAFIEGATSVSTRPVDISGATSDVVRTVALEVPSGASVSGGVPVVTVTVRVEAAIGEATFGVPVTATNLGPGVSISGALPSVFVTVRGPVPELRAMGPRDIGAVIDLDGRGPGTYQVAVTLTPPADVEVLASSPAQISVTLEGS